LGFGFTLARKAAAEQVRPARERLGGLHIQIERLPGGHLTAHEQPEALAALISEFERTARR